MSRLAGSMRSVLREFSTAPKPPVLAFPKPSQIRHNRPAVKVFPDGREVCLDTRAGRAEYARRREEAYERDEFLCCICHLPILEDDVTTEHKGKRGMNGGRRDDRTEKNGVAHAWCNSKLGSRRLEGGAA